MQVSPIAQEAYHARGKAARSWIRETHPFTSGGVSGVSLADALEGRLLLLDGMDDLIFQHLGEKVTYHLIFPGHKHFRRQKWNKCTRDGQNYPITREKIVVIIAQVLRTFLDSLSQTQGAVGGKSPGFLLGAEYIPFEEFYLLRVEQYGSSVQPILGRYCAQAAVQQASPLYETAPVHASQTQPTAYRRPVVERPKADTVIHAPVGFPAASKPVEDPDHNWIFDPGDAFGCGMAWNASELGTTWGYASTGPPATSHANLQEVLAAQDLISSLSNLTLEQSFEAFGPFNDYCDTDGAGAFDWLF